MQNGKRSEYRKRGDRLSYYDSLHRLTNTIFGQRNTGGSDPYKGWTYDDLGNHLRRGAKGVGYHSWGGSGAVSQ